MESYKASQLGLRCLVLLFLPIITLFISTLIFDKISTDKTSNLKISLLSYKEDDNLIKIVSIYSFDALRKAFFFRMKIISYKN